MKRYRIERGESYAETNGLKEARLIAGEWDAEPGMPVFIIRQRGLTKRWRATLEPCGRVRLDAASDSMSVDDFENDRLVQLARLIDREAARQRRKLDAKQTAIANERLARSLKFGKGVARKVVCLSSDPHREFANIVLASEWAGVPHTCIIRACHPMPGKRRGKAAGMEWAYKSELESRKCEPTTFPPANPPTTNP